VDPLALFLDVVPYSSPAPEDGLLGVFPMQEIDVPHAALAQGGVPRMLVVPRDGLQSKLATYDVRKTRASLDAFAKYVGEKAGQPIAASAPGKQMEDAGLALLAELKGLLEGAPADAQLVMRRLTETEALSDGALAAVREAMQGPRIILTP
jgi:hypothetical protein